RNGCWADRKLSSRGRGDRYKRSSADISLEASLYVGERYADGLSRGAEVMRACLAGRLPLLRLADDPDQEMLGLDRARSCLCGRNTREANDHPGARRERDCSAWARPRFALQLAGEDLPADPERFQRPSRHVLAQGIEAEYQVFRADVVVVPRPCFGLGLL